VGRDGAAEKMIRKAFVMYLNEGRRDDYESRHNPIWPDLQEVLKSHGVSNYSIFFNEKTNELFGYAEIESEEQWAAIAQTEPCKKWWAHMRDLMATNEDNSPVSLEIEEVFHLD
jgi:L-rhamnose mutarotase